MLAVLLRVAEGPAIEGVRKIRIPTQEHGYKNFFSLGIGSQATLDGTLAQWKKQDNWNHRDAFLKAIADTKVDFAKVVLVLIRSNEGGGPVEVHFRLAEGRDGALTAMIFRREPRGDVLLLESYYCFALAVRRDRVKQIKVWRLEDVLEVPEQ